MAEHSAANSGFVQLSDSVYDTLRLAVEKLIPGFGALYFAFSTIWGWAAGDKVVASCAAITVFGGIVLSLARKGYSPNVGEPPGGYDGAVVEGTNEAGEPTLRLQLDPSTIDNLMNKEQLVIKGYDPSA